ncbi:probable leucine-rich repeat receptor-like protein kinase At1g35710 [Telopea speciosissima]|uniref:probable leucine-rich repeat receptor-like protein kinase At1g35710 n=1 Tax=Telopea speciosissima TaxID=54955 RepID=UPI001CC71865|nr:probable leucine-rich repeat receptor-like protein kinase At1g35710 [Telopea speciosissima]
MAFCNPNVQESLCSFFLFFTLLLASSYSSYALSSISTSTTSVTVDQAMALLEWKDSLNNQSQTVLHSWKLLDPNATNSSLQSDLCSWYGISCNQRGIITEINLPSMGLQGMVKNFPFPSLPSLMRLNLNNNSLFGSVPSNIGNLSVINYLDLSKNHLSELIPLEICSLTGLEILSLGDNCFHGSIPYEMGRLKNLTSLTLFSNNLSGSIPTSLGNLSNLQQLSLYQNKLNGSIPVSLGNLRYLTILRLLENQLSGIIPLEIGNMSSLKNLELGDNHFSGVLPQGLCMSRSLVNFSAPNNHFTGLIPRGFKNCTGLVRVELQNNQLAATLSKDFGVYEKLNYIDLRNNQLNGELTSSTWFQCKNLQALLMSGNKITGKIPPDVGKLTQLHELDLSSNYLVGEIPKEFGELTYLLYLNLRGNQLSGSLPSEIGKLYSLTTLDLSGNSLSGQIPKEIGNCSNLLYLDLSNNRLNGSIPFQIGNIIYLQILLDLSQNWLSGEMPSQFTNLGKLEKLNLSHNQLSGTILSAFYGMYSLTSIDISYNEFEGPLPKNRAFQNATIERLRNNTALCGNVSGLQPCEHSSLSKPDNKNLIIVMVVVLSLLFLLFASASIACVVHQIIRLRYVGKKQRTPSPGWNLFSVCNFDGKNLYQEIIKATEDFDAKYCIGMGGSGSVYKAKLSTNQVVAVKKLHQPLQDEYEEDAKKKTFSSEIRALTEMRHRNIVKLYGFCSVGQHSLLVYDYFERGSLAKVLENNELASELDWEKRIVVIKGVANALSYMHNDCIPPIIHRDISSNNILLNVKYEACVSDFGTARLMQPYSSNYTPLVGTRGYIAPGNKFDTFLIIVELDSELDFKF